MSFDRKPETEIRHTLCGTRAYSDSNATRKSRGVTLTHKHSIADVVVCAYVFSCVRNGVEYTRRETQLGQVAYKAGEQRVVDRGKLCPVR